MPYDFSVVQILGRRCEIGFYQAGDVVPDRLDDAMVVPTAHGAFLAIRYLQPEDEAAIDAALASRNDAVLATT